MVFIPLKMYPYHSIEQYLKSVQYKNIYIHENMWRYDERRGHGKIKVAWWYIKISWSQSVYVSHCQFYYTWDIIKWDMISSLVYTYTCIYIKRPFSRENDKLFFHKDIEHNLTKQGI